MTMGLPMEEALISGIELEAVSLMPEDRGGEINWEEVAAEAELLTVSTEGLTTMVKVCFAVYSL